MDRKMKLIFFKVSSILFLLCASVTAVKATTAHINYVTVQMTNTELKSELEDLGYTVTGQIVVV